VARAAMKLHDGARIAVIGAGPSGLVAAKEALEGGFNPTVFEASDDLGGQWYATAAHSGVWPGMHANTSRAMTAFSDFPAPASHPLHPAAEQIHAYLRAYAEHFHLVERIRFGTPARRVAPAWEVDGERFDAVVVASGRFCKPFLPPGLDGFTGELLHTFDYPGAAPFRERRVLVYGNGISGLEVASDLAPVTAPVVSAFRKPRYVIQKVVAGVSSDWQWYTAFGALQRRLLARDELSRTLRERVVAVAGDPTWFGAPAPDPDILVAGLSLCQDFVSQVADGSIVCRPAIAAVDRDRVTFADRSVETVDVIICATGYEVHVPYLDPAVWAIAGPDMRLYLRVLHPDLPGFGAVGMFPIQGPMLPLLELQARWLVALWAGEVAPPDQATMRAGIAVRPPPIEVHNVLGTALAEELGVAPDPIAWPELTEPLLFGPLLPPRYRLEGPGARADAPDLFKAQLAASPRAPVDPDDIDALRGFGLGAAADTLLATRA
jgi:dimethylaniline monooxygenase (N-oxide forming)